MVPEGDEEGEYSDAFLLGLVRGRLDFVKGRVYNHEEVKRRLGLESGCGATECLKKPSSTKKTVSIQKVGHRKNLSK